jgi:hypothetical protein
MEYLIGLALAVAVAGFAAVVGFDRDRAFYPTALIVIAAYYVLFAVMDPSRRALGIEIAVACGFVLFAVLGFKEIFGSPPLPLPGTEFFGLRPSPVHRQHLAYRAGGPASVGPIDVALGVLLAVRLMKQTVFGP